LKAVGYKNGQKVSEQIIRTAGEPANIKLSIDGTPLAESGKDIVQVRTTLLDAKGEFYPYGENRIFFNLYGPARIKALDNGKPNDVEPFYGTTDRTAFFGLTRAYIESDKTDGDIALVAGAILGDKKLVVSNLVHIDVQQISLRGNSGFQTLEIFYTTDGSEPTTGSMRYNGGFEIPLNTTVKALVNINGKQALMMEERFAEDVGLLWEGGGLDTDFGGEQAEDAEFSGGSKATEGKNYNGSGYLDLGKNKGSYVEWYQENDGAEAKLNLTIRYSGASKDRKPLTIRLNVNEDMMEKEIELPPCNNWGKQWRSVTIPITLKRGANTIRLTTVDNRGLFIDEIEIN
jgi:beta-galactosidase